MAIDVSVIPQTGSSDDLWEGGADRYDYNRLPAEMRSQAMLAQGTVVEGLSSAVRRVVDAGKALCWAKTKLPHGENLNWVQQACGLKPRYAQQLVQAAEWVNAQCITHLEGASIETLFILSANTTPEDVREWFIERCAAGEVPSRAEVAERKRTAGRPLQPQPAEAMALSILRKGELGRIREAVQLAEQAAVVSAAEVMEEQRLRELGKLRFIPGQSANFHRMKDGSWIRLPLAGGVDVMPVPAVNVEPEQLPEPVEPVNDCPEWETAPLLALESAADRIGMTPLGLTNQLTPSSVKRRNGAPFIRNGFKIAREGRGLVRLTPVAEPAPWPSPYTPPTPISREAAAAAAVIDL